MRTCERTKLIRAGLKKHGFTSRDVSVRAEEYSMGSAIHVVIKNPAVPFALVKSIAAEHEHVRRCEASGEILNGGNTYLHLDYSREVMDRLSAPIAAAISEDPAMSVEVEGWTVSRLNRSEHYYNAQRRGEPEIYCWGREFCARQIVERNLARAHKPKIHVKAACAEVAS